MVNAKERKVDFKILVRAAPEKVYDAMTTNEGLDGWFTQGASVEAVPGGRIQFRWRNWGVFDYTGELGGPVVEATRPERFVFRWPVDSGGYETTVEIDFTAHEDGTTLRLVEQGYEDNPTGMQDFLNRVEGWAHVLTLMKFYVEHGVTY